MLQEVIRRARLRKLIIPRGSSSISRMVACLSDGTSTFWGENSYKTHPMVRRFSRNPDRCCTHAELSAIIKAVSYFTKITGKRRDSYVSLTRFSMYIARVLADGSPALSKPCPDCSRAIYFYEISNVEYTE